MPDALRVSRILMASTALAAASLVQVAVAAPASAHATVVSSSPADGARLALSPADVSITFDEPVSLGSTTYLRVVNSSGRRVDSSVASHPRGQGRVVAVTLRPDLPPDVYVASWRVISADSHPVAGTIRFAVGDAVLTPLTTSVQVVDRVTSTAMAVARFTGFAGLTLLGGLWVVLVSWPAGRRDRRARLLLWTGWGLALGGTVGAFLMQGPYVAGSGVATLVRPDVLSSTFHTDYGQLALARVGSLVVLALVMDAVLRGAPTADRYPAAVLSACALAVALTYSGAGHPRTTPPSWMSVALDSAHLLSVCAWLGGLAMLVVAVLPRRSPELVTVVLPAVSNVATVAVVVIAVSGAYAAFRGVGTLQALTSTYALLVAGKVLLFGGLLGIGACSRACVRRLAATSRRPDRLRHLVTAELSVATVVLALTSVLVAQPRGPEAVATEQSRPVSAQATLGPGRSVRVIVEPGRHGVVAVFVTVTGEVARRITVDASLPRQELGPIPVPLVPDGPHRYSASGVLLPHAGVWRFTVVVGTSEFDATTTAVSIHLH